MRGGPRSHSESQEPDRTKVTVAQEADLGGFVTLLSLIGSRKHITQKHKVLPWLTRTIEELYDARFEVVPAVETEEVDVFTRPHQEVPPFPIFIHEHLCTIYGLKHLVDQTCWDLMYNTQLLRGGNIHVETFGLFLEEVFDENDLLFYLYVRSVLQTELMRSTHTKDSPVEATISWKQVNIVARTIFGRLSEDLYHQCLRTIDKYMLVDEEGEQYVEAINFLYVALVQYHDARKRGSKVHGTPSRGSSVDFDQHSEAGTMKSNDSDAFKDIKHQGSPETAASQSRHYTELKNAELPPAQPQKDTARHDVVLDDEAKAMENTVREIASSRDSSGTSVEGSRGIVTASRAELKSGVNSGHEDISAQSTVSRVAWEPPGDGVRKASEPPTKVQLDGDVATPKSPPPPPPPPAEKRDHSLDEYRPDLTATEQILLVLKRKLQQARQTYLDSVLQAGQLLPGSIRAELFDKVNAELEKKVREIISDIAGARRSHEHSERCTAVPDACIYCLLQRKFREILRSCRETGFVDIHIESQIDDYAKTVISSNEVREVVEPLVALLVTYATAKSDLDPGRNESFG